MATSESDRDLDLAECKFLKSLNYDFNLTHSTEITRIARKSKRHLNHYEKLFALIQDRVAARTSSFRQADRPAAAIFSCATVCLLMTLAPQVVRLNDLVWRAEAQDRMLCQSLMTSTGWTIGPPPTVELESVFRPGRMITIVFDRQQWARREVVSDLDEDEGRLEASAEADGRDGEIALLMKALEDVLKIADDGDGALDS